MPIPPDSTSGSNHSPVQRPKETCVPRDCGTCHFSLKVGESVQVVAEDGQLNGPYAYRLGGFGPRENGSYRYRACTQDCEHTIKTPALHLQCSHWSGVEDDDMSRRDFIETATFSWEPSLKLRADREKWYRAYVAAMLDSRANPADSPYVVAEDDIRKAAGNLVRSRWFLDEHVHHQVDAAFPMFIHYADFEGEMYIIALSNDPPRKTEKTRRIVMAGNPHIALYVASDHVGIRDMAFLTPSELTTVPKIDGVYWTTRPVPGDKTMLDCKTDGIKIRAITWIGQANEPNPVNLWSTPQLPGVPCYRFGSISLGSSPRFTSMECNSEDITGYSIAWSLFMVCLHSHKQGEDMEYYLAVQEEHPSAVWLHMPVCKREMIVQVWKLDLPPPHGLVIAFVTSTGRVKVMGWRLEVLAPGHEFPWQLIKQYGSERNFLHFQESPGGACNIAFNGVPPMASRARFIPPPINSHLALPGAPRSSTPEMHSSASLEGVVMVTPSGYCLDDELFVLGLLLTYGNGQVDSVGEVRVDSMGDPLTVNAGDRLWMGFFQEQTGYELVGVDVRPEQPVIPAPMEWASVPLSGVMDWWFCLTRRRIYHNNQHCQPGYHG